MNNNRDQQMETEHDINKRLALDVKEKIETSSFDERSKLFNNLYQKWIVRSNPNSNMLDYLRLSVANFGLELDGLQMGNLERAKKVVKFELEYLKLKFMEDDAVEKDPELKTEFITKFNKLSYAIIDAENALQSTLFLKSSMTQEDIGTTHNTMFRFSEINTEDNTPYQDLLLFLIEKIRRLGYRRYLHDNNGMCYQPIYTQEGYNTHAWKPVMTIKQFIYDVARKNTNYKMWKNLTAAKDNIKAATVYLTEFSGGEFEDLTKDRNIFSFRNGIYMTKVWNEEAECYVDQWIPYVGEGSKEVGASIIACKYFDMNFVDCSHYDDYFTIIQNHCPNFKHIMDFQDWSEDVQRWLLILTGRLLYSLGSLDDWQCMPFLHGNAGTGKSTYLEHCVKLFYDNADVGILSNNMEKKFGIGPLADKKLIIGPEIKGNFNLEQAEFQSMISAEEVQLNIKFKDAHSKKWDVACICAGNEIPQYTDNSGSITRRVVIFPFNNKVTEGKGDSKLGKKLEKEVAFVMQASCKAYLDAIDKYGSSDLWTILPKEFKESKKIMAENTNGLANFLSSEKVKVAPEMYIREKLFIAAFNDHCRENNMGAYKWSSQYYSGPFADFGLTINKNCRRRYPNDKDGRTYNGTFIFGVDLVDHDQYSVDSDDDD